MKRIFAVNDGNHKIHYTIINNDRLMIDDMGWEIAKIFDCTQHVIVEELIDDGDDYVLKRYILDDLKSYNDFISILDNMTIKIKRTKNGFEVTR